MKYCRNCGSELTDNMKFCGNCGTAMELSQEEIMKSCLDENALMQKNKDDILEYISIVADMENNLYLQNELLDKLTIAKNRLGISKKISMPEKPTYEVVAQSGSRAADNFMQFVAGVGLAMFGLFACFWDSPKVLDVLVGIIFIIVGIGLAVGSRNEVASQKEKEKKAEEDYAENYKEYEASMKEYNKKVYAEKARLKQELNAKHLIECEMERVATCIDESQNRLRKIYDVGVVYPKYRNMVMINTIYEYLKSGRCTSLEGSEGAYNILEKEMRLDYLIFQLDEVIDNLNKIKENQYMLYTAIRDTNDTVHQLVDTTYEVSTKVSLLENIGGESLKQIESLKEESALNNYYLERLNKEMHYMNRMKYFSGEYNGTINNRLP